MPPTNDTHTAEKIFRQVKRLREHMQPEEEPLLAVPAIWDSEQSQRGIPCDVIVTNQRLIGYYSVNMPRKRLFLEEVSLSAIKTVSLRHKTFEPIFRELMVSDGKGKVYIRAPRRQIEALYTTLREATERYVSTTQPTFEDVPEQEQDRSGTAPIYGRQDIRTPFERSPLAITLLFGGGMMLEILGMGLWWLTHNAETGVPLFVAGFIAVVTAILILRQRG